MLRLIRTLSVYVCIFMRLFMPTDIALDALRTRGDLKWGVPAMLLAVVYFYPASVVTPMPTLADLARVQRSPRMVPAIVAELNSSPTGRLLANVGGIETVRLIESENSIPGMGQVDAAVWHDRARTRVLVARVAEIVAYSAHFDFVTPADRGWPVQLNGLDDRAPYGIWTRGDTGPLEIDPQRLVTFSGARAATGYGLHVTNEFAGDLAHQNVTIVAGGAYGVEGAAHSTALNRGGSTIAVLASGVDRPHQSGHTELFDRIGRSGPIVSETPPGSAPTWLRFLDRSRLLAALSAATVVVEARIRSGFMHVVTGAESLGRQIGAVPGPVTSAASSGANLLLQQARAKVITNTPEIADVIVHQSWRRAGALANQGSLLRLPAPVAPGRTGTLRYTGRMLN